MTDNPEVTTETLVEPVSSSEIPHELEHVPLMYRAMKAAAGSPVVGNRSCNLGVRVPQDIVPDANGNVSPGRGMSVRPSLSSMLAFAPKRWRKVDPLRFRGVRGDYNGDVFAMGKDTFIHARIGSDLEFVPDKPTKGLIVHGEVGPAREMAETDFQQALADTSPNWTIVTDTMVPHLK